MDMVDDVQKMYDEGDYAGALDVVRRSETRLARLGLLVWSERVNIPLRLGFQVLRRNDYAEKLSRLRIDAYDSDMSIAQQ